MIDDLEVGGYALLSGRLYMNGHAGLHEDGDQIIYFYDNQSRIGESFMWDESESAFAFSNNLLFEPTTDTNRQILNARGITLQSDIDDDDTLAWFRFYTDGSMIEQVRIEDGDEAADRR